MCVFFCFGDTKKTYKTTTTKNAKENENNLITLIHCVKSKTVVLHRQQRFSCVRLFVFVPIRWLRCIRPYVNIDFNYYIPALVGAEDDLFQCSIGVFADNLSVIAWEWRRHKSILAAVHRWNQPTGNYMAGMTCIQFPFRWDDFFNSISIAIVGRFEFPSIGATIVHPWPDGRASGFQTLPTAL